MQQPAPLHTPTAMPYQFRIVGFQDNRPEQDVRYDFIFPQEHFLREVQTHLRSNLFDTRPAKLRLALTHYTITTYKRDFTLSMSAHMQAVSDLGKTFIDREFHCAQDHHGSAWDVKTLVENMRYNPNAFTKDGWRDKVETKLLETCIQDMMLSFSRAVIRDAPQNETP